MRKCKCTFILYNILQSYIVKIGYDISGEIVPLVRYLQRNRTPGYDFSREIVPIQVGYDFSWVRFLLGTISPDTDRPKSVRNRCVIEVLCAVFFCVVTLLFGLFCRWRGFCHTEDWVRSLPFHFATLKWLVLRRSKENPQEWALLPAHCI